MPFSPTGLSLFTPNGLWALLALAIPVLIHLFNRSRGRLVRIGHIDLIKQARRLKVSEVKIEQWLLLLLRLGIFALAALILAGLARPGLESSESSTAYVTPAWLKTVQAALIDELLDNHDRVFVLQQGFTALNMAVAEEIRRTPLEVTGVTNVWPLLTERLSIQHHAGTVDAYATDLLAQFGTSRPALPRAVNWIFAQPEPAPARDYLPTRVVIAYDMNRKQDTGVFTAALASIKAHRIPALTWEIADTDKLTPEQLNPDWLIYLSNDNLTTGQLALINTPTTILRDTADAPEADRLEYVTLPYYPFSTFSVNRLSRYTDDAQTIVNTSDGTAVLQTYHSGSAWVVNFNSRFGPQWSSITQQAEFPELLLHMMLNRRQQALAFGDARVNIAQLQAEGRLQASDLPLPRRSLQSLLAVLLALLWITERWLSERRRREGE